MTLLFKNQSILPLRILSVTSVGVLQNYANIKVFLEQEITGKKNTTHQQITYTRYTCPPQPLKQSRSTDDKRACEIVSNNSSAS